MQKFMPIQKGSLLKSVPWNVVENHDAMAQSNHGQTLKRLAERGGMAPREMLKIIQGEPLFPYTKGKELEAELKLIEIIAASI